MTRIELDRLLEKTVADALGVELPQRHQRERRARSRSKAPAQRRAVRRGEHRHLQSA